MHVWSRKTERAWGVVHDLFTSAKMTDSWLAVSFPDSVENGEKLIQAALDAFGRIGTVTRGNHTTTFN